ncbi:serine-type endopeptidase [Aureococcus anophagefferens]|nr:serine-type endopeptidase [Aureococcus anophagefferens]
MALLVFVGPAVPLLPGGCPPALAAHTASLCIDAPAAVVDARARRGAARSAADRRAPRRDAAAPRRTSFVANAAALVGPAVVRVDVERGEGGRGATRVAVVTAEGDRKDATVLGVDAHTDLAVLKVADARHLPEAELGDDVALRVGDWVVAIGHPIGLDHTVTLGIVSSKGRSIASPVMSRRDDEVIGINTATAMHADGIGFAIP